MTRLLVAPFCVPALCGYPLQLPTSDEAIRIRREIRGDLIRGDELLQASVVGQLSQRTRRIISVPNTAR